MESPDFAAGRPHRPSGLARRCLAGRGLACRCLARYGWGRGVGRRPSGRREQAGPGPFEETDRHSIEQAGLAGRCRRGRVGRGRQDRPRFVAGAAPNDLGRGKWLRNCVVLGNPDRWRGRCPANQGRCRRSEGDRLPGDRLAERVVAGRCCARPAEPCVECGQRTAVERTPVEGSRGRPAGGRAGVGPPTTRRPGGGRRRH